MTDTIPPVHACRTLVLCFDGTGIQFCDDNSNVLQLFNMLKKEDPSQQVVYYQARTGTSIVPQLAMPLLLKWKNPDPHVLGMPPSHHNTSTGGYEFLVQNYEAGDKICLFGFSRGAYTARALAGMLHKVGLLPRCNHQHVLSAYKMYSMVDEKSWKSSAEFKKAWSIDVDVEFIGVWDTVNPGISPRRLPFTWSNSGIRVFRQALALDEHRVGFTPILYHKSELGVKNEKIPRSQKRPSATHPPDDKHLHDKSNPDGRREASLQELERRYTQQTKQTDADEVWFAGCHSDVGGGSVASSTRYSLARIPLRWMIREIFKTNVGILFHRSMFQQIGMDPSTLYPGVVPRPPAIPMDSHADLDVECVSEETEDLHDALSPVYDQLMRAPYWWILEVLPQKLRYQRKTNGTWAESISVHMGRARHIPMREPPRIHRTVKTRMEVKYFPKARIRSVKVEPQWVD
ncbi:hypothetical protein EDD15DRAFT_2572829 [Pisolithus albus]|nr:hypothetical protein EDD15DRAFT_2572829 [Pisolithus albus]